MTKVRPAKFAHVVMRTNRFREMLDWYETVLHAWSVHENEFLAFLTYDDEHHRLAFVNMPNGKDRDPEANGTDHIAYTYASLDDLMHTYERLKTVGIKPVWTINHGPTTSMYYADPDGNRVELQIDNYDSVKALNDWFKTADFADNPLGVEFDPDTLLEKHRGGLTKEDLQDRNAMATW